MIELVRIEKKATKAEAHYTPRAAHHQERCGLCRYFVARQTCRRIQGEVNAGGWCKYFERATRRVVTRSARRDDDENR